MATSPKRPEMPPKPRGDAVLEGVLERVTWASEESGFSVVRLQVPGRKELVTAVGPMVAIQPGESVRLTGRWVLDKKWGEQFRADSFATVKPATLVGIERYLGSGLVRGVGRVMAERLVHRFGLETLEVIDRAPERLREVEGIGPLRSERIRTAWAEQREIRTVMVFLQSHGVATGHAVKIWKRYRERAIATVEENPYRLALDIWGIGFKTADGIARNLGVEANSPRRAEAGVLHVLGGLSDEGHVFFPRDRLVESAREILEIEPPIIEQAIDAMAAEDQLVVEAPRAGEASAVYLRSLHAAESGAAALLRELLRAPVRPIAIDVEKAIAWFEQRQQIALAPEQREAIRQAIAAKVLVITGGPGTGKTTLVNGIIQILQKKGRRIELAAPTGRAAKRLSQATGREARTVHRLLEFTPKAMRFARNRDRPLEADLVILDEASMVDTVLGFDLVKALPPYAQLVLVGDVDQLPSVGPGSVLSDVIASGAVPVARLVHIFRQAEQSLIVENAHRINRGEMPREGSAKDADFFFIRQEEPEGVLATLKSLVAERIPKRFGFDPVDDIQVLTPMHRGLLGAGNLNAELQALLNPKGEGLTRGSRTFRRGDKVMQLRNNYDLEVFNGDLGRAQRIDAVEQQIEVVFDGRPVVYDFADLDELTLAYACTVHKSQGSEYPCVVIPLHTQHYAMLQRNLLYTAVTRGRKLVVLVGSVRALAIAVKSGQKGTRYTQLAARLRE
jgi:exodeoxyribonuclease V alpha subunit